MAGPSIKLRSVTAVLQKRQLRPYEQPLCPAAWQCSISMLRFCSSDKQTCAARGLGPKTASSIAHDACALRTGCAASLRACNLGTGRILQQSWHQASRSTQLRCTLSCHQKHSRAHEWEGEAWEPEDCLSREALASGLWEAAPPHKGPPTPRKGVKKGTRLSGGSSCTGGCSMAELPTAHGAREHQAGGEAVVLHRGTKLIPR